ncbi:LIM/homeobox protein Awh-like isoform X2 [Mya arenaria]|uniref:LIM/homeobox protein Awh-like isoform X2 n=1 Tax=Mya arenaria TaxID=6604 RepID=UPI0022E695F9|nr:LIM/homeobox protein Awh-like isoform X2 [Mya arenaria]
MDFRSIHTFVNSPGSDGLRYSPSPTGDSPKSYISLDDPRHKPTRPTCQSCQRLIEERWMLHVGKQHYHAACLRCSTCQRTLDSHSSCFFREGLIFCRNHYLSRYSTKCAGCSDPLQPSDWVRRARDLVYHLECFRCSTCHRKLSTGDTCVLKGDTMLCPDHIAPHVGIEEPDNVSICSMDSESRGSESSEEKHGNGNTSTGSGSGNGKRQRTSFTAEQVATLQDEFRRNPNPSPEDLERIADLTGHTRKVVMIWFQNARARNKKLLLNGGSNPLPSKKQGIPSYHRKDRR